MRLKDANPVKLRALYALAMRCIELTAIIIIIESRLTSGQISES